MPPKCANKCVAFDYGHKISSEVRPHIIFGIKGWWHKMAFILHTTLNSLIIYICIVGTCSNGQVIQQILSALIFQCSLTEMRALEICEGRPLSATLGGEMPTSLMCHPSLQDQDCTLSEIVQF